MKPNTQTLAITTGLISCSPDPIRRRNFPIKIALPRCIVGLHKMRSAQPTRLLRMPERTFVIAVAR